MRIESIADHLELLDTIAAWHWQEWGHHDPDGSLHSWRENLGRYTNRDRIPTMFVALDGAALVGSVGVVPSDMTSHPELAPWISGMFVEPEARGRGVASALMHHAMQWVSRQGSSRIYLYTGSARGLYDKLGWQTIAEEAYEGRIVTMMAKEITPG